MTYALTRRDPSRSSDADIVTAGKIRGHRKIEMTLRYGHPSTDAWGNKFIVQIEPKNNTYRIASAGSDGRFSGFGQKGEYSDLAGKDIIFADGAPAFVPKLEL